MCSGSWMTERALAAAGSRLLMRSSGSLAVVRGFSFTANIPVVCASECEGSSDSTRVSRPGLASRPLPLPVTDACCELLAQNRVVCFTP